MKRIYLDNASTSWPKAPGVSDAAKFFLDEVGSNVNRGSYEAAYSAESVLLDTRARLCQLLGGASSRQVVFTSNITHSLNLLLKGFLRPGDHVLVSSMEHNAVMRPLVQMGPLGVSFTRIPCNSSGELDPADIYPLVRSNTRAVVLLHASNVCGTLLPLAKIGAVAKEHGLRFFVDAAQTAGVFPIHMGEMHIDALAFTGHKSLLGPQGVGGLLLAAGMAAETAPLIAGGTGSLSDSEEIPAFLPDRFEAGTPNLPGIYGLHAALCYLEQTGIDAIRAREIDLARRLHDGLGEIPGIRLPGTGDWSRRAPIVSADFSGYDNAAVSFALSDTFGILTRCGLHCAPSAHKTIGTFPQGTVRFSVSHFNTEEEIDRCLGAVCETMAALPKDE